MSDANGPYTLNEDDAGRYVISDMPSHLATFESHLDASVAVLIANLAHHHALSTQAARIDLLTGLVRDAGVILSDEPHPDDGGSRAIHMLRIEIAKALTPPAEGGSNDRK